MSPSSAERCAGCGAALPDDAQFCIECGRAARAQAVTGPTQHLCDVAEPDNSVRCANCGTSNPDYARFCVMCGQPFAAASNVPQPLAPPAPALPPVPASAPQPRPFLQGWNLGGAVFMIGLVVLFITRWWWPGIMVVLGLSSLAGGINSRNHVSGVQGAVWMIGIAVLAVTRLWWPGILVLSALSALIGMLGWPRPKP